MVDALRLCSLLVVHLILTGVPLLAGVVVAGVRGVRGVPWLLASGLIAVGITGYGGWWATFGSQRIGLAYSLVLYGTCLAFLGVAALRYRSASVLALRTVALPLALTALGAAFVTALGFMFGGMSTAIDTGRYRFNFPPVATDNSLPFEFARGLFRLGHSAPHLVGDWLSSDRPPLQSGVVLAQQLLRMPDPELHYQVVGVVVQSLWIPALWALLVAGKVARVPRALAMIVCLTSAFVVINGFFVWPKLLPSAFLLVITAFLLTDQFKAIRASPWAGMAIGASAALAMLGHGGSVFAFLGVGATMLIRRHLPGWRFVTAALAAALALMIPWMAYRASFDPPGNRLEKWHLAGVVQPDDRSTLEAIREEYGRLTWSQLISNRRQNLANLWSEPGVALTSSFRALAGDQGAAAVARNRITYYFAPALGLMLLGPLALVVGWRRARHRSAEWRLAATMWICVAIGVALWSMVMFVPGMTYLHAGTYLFPLLALGAGALAWWTASRPIALVVTGLHVLLSLASVVTLIRMPEVTSVDWSLNPVTGGVGLACLAGFSVLVFRPQRTRTEPPDRQREEHLEISGMTEERVLV